MIILLCALSSNRDFAGFFTHKQEKIPGILVISLLVQIFSLMCSCFILVLRSNKMDYCHLFCNSFLMLLELDDSQEYYYESERGVCFRRVEMVAFLCFDVILHQWTKGFFKIISVLNNQTNIFFFRRLAPAIWRGSMTTQITWKLLTLIGYEMLF